jgi:hypothetical protein
MAKISKSANSAIEILGVSTEDAIKADRRITKAGTRDPRVCICGHAVNRHVEQDGVQRCFPSRMTCVCQGIRPVLEVSDTRVFLRKSTGPGVDHALLRGLSALAIKGGEASWIEEPICELCGVDTTTEQIVPVPFTIAGAVCYDDTQLSGKHALLCRPCMRELGR